MALLAELATGTEIAHRMRQRRCVGDALRAGVTIEQVVARVGANPGEVSAALIARANGQRRVLPDRFSEDDVAEVCARAGASVPHRKFVDSIG